MHNLKLIVMETNSNSSTHNSRRFNQRRKTQNSSVRQGLVFGLLLILAGLLFLSFNFGWIDPALKWVIFSWPMILIVFSILSFSKRDFSIAIIFLILGAFFILPRLAMAYPEIFSVFNHGFARTYWPVLLIIVGILIIFRIGSGKRGIGCDFKKKNVDTTISNGGRVDKIVTFGGSESIFLDPVFNGGNISTTFGGVVLDLRKTSLPEGETILDINALFGGVELNVPDGWFIDNRLQTIMGGVEDKRRVFDVDLSRKLILQGTLIFGGCEVS